MSLPLAQIDFSARDVLIAVNPRAGAREQSPVVEDLVARLVDHKLRPQVFRGVDELCGHLLGRSSLVDVRGVVAAGGDGTARLVAECMPPEMPLTILPLGTENLLARHLELSTDTRAMAERIAGGLTVQLDAGLANGRLFTLMVGCGFDADVVRRLHRDRRGHIHHLSYIKPIVDAIRNYDYPPVTVHCRCAPGGPSSPFQQDGASGDEVLTARWVFVVNLPRYAGGLNIAPEASGTDGLFDVCTFKEGSLWSGLLYLGGVVLGQHQAMDDFHLVRCAELTIESTAAVPYQIDGDPGGELPLTIRILPKRLTLLVTRPWAERQQAETHQRVTT
ncbi:MAG TPA: diacylglycerol kinase family protein [Pirellulaceae bacterium]|nr:diacylglycerol kinase family protein [Pirellulaceae bacterium]